MDLSKGYWMRRNAGTAVNATNAPAITTLAKISCAVCTPSACAVKPASVAPTVITERSMLTSAITRPRISAGAVSSSREFVIELNGVWNMPISITIPKDNTTKPV